MRNLEWGDARREFERLAAIETDECLIWRFSGNGQGHGRINVGGNRREYVHRLALSRRVPQPADKQFALHGPCHNPACMNYRHLRWGTKAENQQDRRRDGTYQQGETAPGAKLTAAAVADMRRRFALGTGFGALAGEFGVSTNTVSAAVRRRTWKDVE